MGKTALLAFAAGLLYQLFDETAGLEFIQGLDGFPETILGQFFDLTFVEFGFVDNLYDEILLLRAAGPAFNLAVAITTVAMAVAVAFWQESDVPDVPVNIGLQRGKELSALGLNLADIADLFADGQGELMAGIPGQPEFF